MRLSATDPIRQIGGLPDELQRTREIKGIVDSVQIVEVGGLGELHKGQPVAGVIGIEEVTGEGQEFAAVLGQPIVIERVEFLEPLARAPGAANEAASGVTQIWPPHSSRAMCIICGRLAQAWTRPA